MAEQADVDLVRHISLDAFAAIPPRVLHPCRCDAPDPEAARIEPIHVPLDELVREGRAVVECPECAYRVLVIRS